MIQKLSNNKTPVYEILDYIITPSSSKVNTDVLVDGTTVVEMTCMLNKRSSGNSRFFSSNDTNTDEGCHASGTWGLQFEDSGLNLSIKMLGADYSKLGSSVIVRTGITYNDLSNKKLRYNLTSAGILTIFNTDDTVFRSYDATAETDTSVTSSTPIKLFHRFVSHEYINDGTYVYDVKIFDNDVLIRHYLPVKRLSDNTYGLYDNVNKTFHQNEVSGYSFTGTSKSEKEYIYSSQTQYVNNIIINATHINRIYNKGEIYWGNNSVVPTYEVLDYIENTLSSNTSMSYINTRFRPTYNTRLEFKFFYPSDRVIKDMYGGVLSFGCMAWGSPDRTNSDLSFTNIYWTNYSHGLGQTWIAGSRIGNNTSNYYQWDQYHNFIQDTQDHMLEGTISTSLFNMNVDGEAYSLSPVSSGWTGIDGTVNTVSELYLFTGIWANIKSDPIPPSTAVTSRCYYFKIYDNDVLVRHFIPVKRLLDGEVGMYDIVNEIFYGSESQMKFIGHSKSKPEYIYKYTFDKQ